MGKFTVEDAYDNTLKGAWTFSDLMDELMDARKPGEAAVVRLEITVSIPPRERPLV